MLALVIGLSVIGLALAVWFGLWASAPERWLYEQRQSDPNYRKRYES